MTLLLLFFAILYICVYIHISIHIYIHTYIYTYMWKYTFISILKYMRIMWLIHICFLIITWDTVITLLVNGSTLYLGITYPTPFPGGKVCSFIIVLSYLVLLQGKVRLEVRQCQRWPNSFRAYFATPASQRLHLSARAALRNSMPSWIPSKTLACCWALVPHFKIWKKKAKPCPSLYKSDLKIWWGYIKSTL